MYLASDAAQGFVILFFVAGLYLLPTILAFGRNVASPWSVAVINVLLGWTLIGWAVALAMAVRDPKPTRA